MSHAEYEWPTPSFEEAVGASIDLYSNYGHYYIDEDETTVVYEEELESTLNILADSIMNGETNSHLEVARVIKSVIPSIGPIGGTMTEIDHAAYRVVHAILQMQDNFTDITFDE